MQKSPKRFFLLEDLSACLSSFSDTPLLDVRFFLSDILQCPLAEIFYGIDLSDQEYDRLMGMLHRRMKLEPVAYILGYTEFWGLRFFVDASVLICRPDTELLVETVLAQHDKGSICCLDLGSGSGAIALALASERDKWCIDGVDCSSAAVSCAIKNRQLHSIDECQVAFFQDDWKALSSPVSQRVYDVVVSNPPYIDYNCAHVTKSTRLFEPSLALFSSGSGLASIKHVIAVATVRLAHAGSLYIEHGFSQAKDVRSLLASSGFCDVYTIQDYAGHDRVTYAKKMA